VPLAGGKRSVEPSADLVRPVRVVVVDDLRRSEAAQAVAGSSGCGRGHLDAHGRGELNGQGTGVAGSVGDQEPLTSTESQHRQGLPRGEAVDRQRRRFHRLQPGRARRRMSRGEQDAFGPEAASTGQRSLVREHPVADGELIDIGADRPHPARALHSQRRRGAQPHVPAGAVEQPIPPSI
jgi:hypothetical protein